MFQIAMNLLADRRRRMLVRARYRQFLENDTHRCVETIDPYIVARDRQQLALLVRTLGEMPERTRTMFVLYKFEKLAQEEIAQRFGISKSAVKQQIARAMAILTLQMGGD